jgi:hypothetical protein
VLRAPALYALRVRRRALRRRDGERMLMQRFHDVTGRQLDLGNPQSFTEKLYWRMITDHRQDNPVFSTLADKYQVRSHIADVVGERYLVPLLWHGVDPADLPFDTLPDRYVIKTSHACSQVLRIDADVDRDVVTAQLRSWLRANYYWAARENQYFSIKPRVLVEEYVEDCYPKGPLDYRFFCFDGEPVMIQVSDHAHEVHQFFDLGWNRLDVRCRAPRADYPVARPVHLDEMADVASKLSAALDFVRVDLYDLQGDVRVGELTFTPNAGYQPFQPESVDLELGRRWRLPTGTSAP